jgi:cytochrome bd-type quinol oxidase subunit 2
LSGELSETYSEYAADSLTIQLLLSSVVVTGMVTLASIAWLLMRLKNSKLLQDPSLRVVSVLMFSLFGVAASFAALLMWLGVKNTLPPSILLILLVAILLATAAAFVVASLKNVLREATAARQELDGVI